MSSMPPPIATAGRGTRGRTDTAWQSIIVVAECLSRGGPVNTPTDQASRRRSSRDLDPSICRRPPESLPSIIDGTGSDDLREAFAVGAMTKPLVVTGARPRVHIAVRFKPGFAFAALGIPASEMTDERVSYELLRREAGDDVAFVATQTTNERRLAVFVELVRRRLFGSAPRVPQSVRAAVRRIVSAGGNLRIESLASEIGVTRQGLAKQFATHVGLTPKTLAKISRTRLALARADAARAAYPRNIDWSAIAYELGYYDQPHFIDEFKAITGSTPGEWERRNALER